MRQSIRLFIATGWACASTLALAATPPADPVAPSDFHAPVTRIKALDRDDARAVTTGGAVRLRWNHQLLSEFGLTEVQALRSNVVNRVQGFDLALTRESSFAIDGSGNVIDAIAGGGGQLAGGFRLSGKAGAFEWGAPRFVVRAGEATRIDFVGDDGSVWFYADKLMYEFLDGGTSFRIRSADLRISAELAQRLGRPDAEGALAAELRVLAPVTARSSAAVPKAPGDPNFHGEPVPGFPGSIYQADVFMQAFTAFYGGCQSCDGPGGASDGQIKFVPSSTLLNNRNMGSPTATIVGDPLGTSSALHTADVSWYEKFGNPFSPYSYPYPGNDQHPYLIWNLYRLDANGGLMQIGRSGVKHAFLTINVGAGCDSSNGGHILGRSCSDTYGTGNNDNPGDLGPRSELVPATGQFGRCRSIFDTACDGTENAVSTGAFDRRMLVRESAVDPASNPGATWLFESWYVVQDDVNIYNTMATRPFSSTFGATWSATNGNPFRLGPAIDRWVDPAVPNPLMTNRELVAEEGHAQVGVKVVDLGGGSFRYNYAVMNHDFARAVTQGTPPNLEVLRNLGFNSFSVPVRAGSITSITFNDGDANASNDWIGQLSGGRVTWTAPAGNELNWGALYSFSFVANAGPFDTLSRLGVAEPGNPPQYSVPALVPDEDVLFANGFN